jgi:nucleotide-binding universal stress UspA family protein
MLQIEKILAPVDLSAASRVTLRCASALARSFHSSLTLLYVSAATGEACQELEALARTELGSSPFHTTVLPGDPARVIVETARSGHFGLIAMSTRGYGPFRRLLLGSVTTEVLDETECPVFTGAHLEDWTGARCAGFDNVVCAVDLGPKSEPVARWAGDFAAAVKGRLFLIHVVPSLGAIEGDYFRSDSDVTPAHQAYEDLKALCAKLGLIATAIVAGGEIADAIALQVSQLGAGVLIAGRGMPAGRLGRLRSQALQIIRGVPCPVITV